MVVTKLGYNNILLYHQSCCHFDCALLQIHVSHPHAKMEAVVRGWLLIITFQQIIIATVWLDTAEPTVKKVSI